MNRAATLPDDELVAAARAGDAQAAEALLARHEPQIYRFGLRMCGNEQDAREVLQETLFAAFRNLHQFRAEARLSTWLFQIARSFCIKQRRSPGPTHGAAPLDGDALQIPADEPLPDVRTHAHELAAALGVALQALSPPAREVVLLRDVEGLTAEEAATAIGIEVGALKSRLHRARAELRTHLSALLAGPAAERTGGRVALVPFLRR